LTLLLVLAVAATGAFTFLRLRRASTAPARKLMLAVLPFTNLSGDPQQEYFSDGLTEEVIARLGNLNPSHLGVIARTSVMGYKNSSKRVDQIARELGVDYVLESSVRRSGKQARITVQLIQVRDQTHLWAQSYDGEVGNVLQLEREIADATARAVSLNFNQGEAAVRPAEVLIDPEAHEHYLKGRYYWRKHTTADLLRSVNEFQQALGQDRNYALAYVGLAETYNAMAANGQASPAEFLPKAISAAQSALRLDPALGEAHAVLAHIKFLRDWDYAGAEQEYRRALELSPGYVEAHHYYGIMLMFSGRLEQALRELKQAQELDPLDSVNSSALGLALLYAHQDNLALEQARKILEWAPNDAVPHVLLGFCHMRAKRYEQAVPEMQRAAELSGRDSEALGWLGWALAVAGRRSEALRILAELQSPPPGRYVAASDIAAVYAGLGDREKALEYLETAVRRREGDVVTIKVQFAFEPLHADPRFQALERRVGLISPSGS
jgi:TolB-like protein/Flp pilus assembly protein TadD